MNRPDLNKDEFDDESISDAMDIWSQMCDEDEICYGRCTECGCDITPIEDNNNLGMCDLCYKETRYM